jgi:hypothetical protein
MININEIRKNSLIKGIPDSLTLSVKLGVLVKEGPATQ